MTAVVGVMVSMANHNKLSLAARLASHRVAVQSAFLLAWLGPLLPQQHQVCGPVFHCHSCPLALFACPIGVLTNFSVIHVFPYLAIGTLVVVGSLLGSFVCGWACPFGFLQDLLGRVTEHKYEPPAWTGYFRYLVLAGLVVAVPYFLGQVFICRVCPAGAVEVAVPFAVQTAIQSGHTEWPTVQKMAVLAVFLISAIYMWRPWCTVLCPLGAIFGLFNRASMVYLRFHPDRCKQCSLCRKLCHYGGRSSGRAGELQCIRCLDCTRCKALTVENVFFDRSGRPCAEARAK